MARPSAAPPEIVENPPPLLEAGSDGQVTKTKQPQIPVGSASATPCEREGAVMAEPRPLFAIPSTLAPRLWAALFTTE